MQKRYARSNEPTLPVTIATSKERYTRRNQPQRNNASDFGIVSYPLVKVFLFVVIGVVSLLILSIKLGGLKTRLQRLNHLDRKRVFDLEKSTYQQELNHHDLSLSKFTTLTQAIETSELVALYFAAAWCPQSIAFSSLMEENFSSQSSKSLDRVYDGTKETSVTKKSLAIVYVSSDESEEEMMKNLRHNWLAIPFHSPERKSIKIHFRVCAENETKILGIERLYQIPTLLIVDSLTHTIVTTDGKNDVVQYGEKAVDHWLRLRDLIRSMQDKYLKTESV